MKIPTGKLLARIVAITVITAACMTVNASEKWKSLRIATEAAYPPFAFKTSAGELAGFDIDFIYAVCMQMQVKCEIVEQNWDGLLPGLQGRKYDAVVASMSITEVRKKVVDFTNRYYRDPARFIALKGSDLQDTPAGLAGKTIGVLTGTAHQEYIERNFPNTTLKLYPTQEDVYLDLLSGRLDAAVANGIAIEFGFLKSAEGKDYAFFGRSHYDPAIHGEGTGIAVRKEDRELTAMFNTAIDEMRANGSYQAVNSKYFSFDIYGE